MNSLLRLGIFVAIWALSFNIAMKFIDSKEWAIIAFGSIMYVYGTVEERLRVKRLIDELDEQGKEE